MKIVPIFDFSVPDWEYYALLTLSADVDFSKKGAIHLMALFYKDGHLKSKGRIAFPSGNKIKFDKEFPELTLDEYIKFYISMMSDFPNLIKKSIGYDVIKNETTRGQDLFDLFIKNPNVQFTYTEISD